MLEERNAAVEARIAVEKALGESKAEVDALRTRHESVETTLAEHEAKIKACREEREASASRAEKAEAEVALLRTSTVLEVRDAKGVLLSKQPIKIQGATAIRHGDVIYFGKADRTKVRIKYTDGRLNDQNVSIRDEKGKLIMEGPIVNGFVHGLWTFYDEGKPMLRISYREGETTEWEVREDGGAWRPVTEEELGVLENMFRAVMSLFVEPGLAPLNEDN